MAKTKLFVKRNAGLIGRVDASNEDVVILAPRFFNQLLKNNAPSATPPKTGINIDRMLDRILVCRPCPECAGASEAHQFSGIILNSDDRKLSLRFGVEPPGHHLNRSRVVVVKSRRVDDGIVEDRQNGRRVAFLFAFNGSHNVVNRSIFLTSPERSGPKNCPDKQP